MRNTTLKIFFALLVLGFIHPVFVVADDAALATQCAAISASTSGCPGLNATDCKALLQQCSTYYDQQSQQISQDITKTTQQKNTLSNQISILQSKIQNLQDQISQGNIKVNGLNSQIADTKSSITTTAGEISTSQSQITDILNSIYQEDQKPPVEILLEGNLSDFFSNLAYLETLNGKVSNLLETTKDLQAYLQGQNIKMDGEVTQLQQTIALQAAQKQESQATQQTQQQYLAETEVQYQQQLQNQQAIEAQSAKIKALLFQIVGVPNAPTFGQALQAAQAAAGLVGVRPAFLLAIISQESSIGKNVGQCELTDLNATSSGTGSGKHISTGALAIRVMKPTRDIAPFLQITQALGRDPTSTPVSCWIAAYVGGAPTGWGGAMGPAQFIPSTWELFESKLQTVLGHAPDPWAIEDSFAAAGMYLGDLGATAQTESAEKNAASRYYGGSASYASSVWNRETCIQTFITSNAMSTYCQNLIF